MKTTMKRCVTVGLAAIAVLGAPGGAAADEPLRWTEATPDAMLDRALVRASSGRADAVAGLVVAAALEDRATFGRARDGLATIGASSSPLADDARWLRLSLLPEPKGAAWSGVRSVSYDSPADSLVKAFAILGPFQDTGGGLARREGPEAAGRSFSDVGARYSWGVFDVGWRRTLPASSTARGVPLDLYIHPRTESCTYLASKVTLPAGSPPVIVHVASTGAVRLAWDGVDAASSEDVHPKLVLDRLAARVDAPAGSHLLVAKVCSGSMPDDGRLRVRFTDASGRDVAVESSSDLRGFQPLAADAARVTAVPTALAAGLALGVAAAPAKPAKGKPAARPAAKAPEPTLEHALASAILRTLGGAEDSRSPRAPGLLDTVARGTASSPDALAMAGWVSPFGANRSGWLNLALGRAITSGDAATRSFAQRRIIASHLGASHADWALSLAEEEPVRSATDAEARLIRALVQKQLGGGGTARAAREALVKLTDELGDGTPASVWVELSRLTQGDPALGLRVAERLAATEPGQRDAAYVRAFRVKGAAAVEVAAAESLAGLTSADDVMQIGHELLQLDRRAWAREIFYVATLLAPNRAGGFEGLGTVRQAILGDEVRTGASPSEDARLGPLSLSRALDLQPSDARLKAELAFRSGEGSETDGVRAAMPDEEYIVPEAVFLARAKADPAKKGEVVDRQLHWVRVVTYHADKRVSQLMHYSREIVIEPRTQDDLYESGVPAEGDETELLFARLHRKDGTTAEPEEQSAGGGRPIVRWPALHTGDVVEVAVRSWTSGPVGRRGDAPFFFIDWVGSVDTSPILWNAVVIDSPDASPLAVEVLNGKADKVTSEKRDGRTITKYVWEDPPEVPDEPLAPQLSETLPLVVGSTFASWNDFREWYRGAVEGFTEPDDQVRRLAVELTAGKKTRDDRIRALFDFVADDIRYVNFVSGEWWLPNRPQELLARRQGDCDDKAILLISLLKAIGIEATEVLVQTRYTGQPSVLRGEKAAIPLFDHGIAYLPGKNGAPGTWLDATSPQSRMGPLPSMDARAVALFIDEGPAKIIDTPASAPADHGVDTAWTITLEPSGAGDLVASETHMGDAAFELRMNLKEKDARAQWVETYLANGWFPAVQVKPEVTFSPDLPRGAAVLKYAASSGGFARREGRELAVPISETTTFTSELAPLVKRTLPVVLPPGLAPGHEKHTITIVAPAGYAFAELPPGGVEAGGEFGSAQLSFARVPGKADRVVVTRDVVFDMSTIPVAKYQAWRGWLQRADRLMHQMVRIVPVEKASP